MIMNKHKINLTANVSEEDILKIKTIEDQGYRAASEHAERILEGGEARGRKTKPRKRKANKLGRKGNGNSRK